MHDLTPCPVCAERDPDSRARDGDRWRCLACGAGWSPADSAAGISGADPATRPTIRNLDELIELLRGADAGLDRLGEVLRSGDLRYYLRARLDPEDPRWGQAQEVLERLGGSASLALFALRYVLVPEDPLELAPGTVIRSPGEIVALAAPGARSREAVLAGLRALASDGRLGEWLRVRGAGGWADAVSAMDGARRAYPKEPELAVYALLWHVAPDLGFPVDGGWVSTTKALAAWMDRDPARRERGLELLDRGWIPTWLAAKRAIDDPKGLFALVDSGLTRGARAEILLNLLNPKRRAPKVTVDPLRLKLRVSEASPEKSMQVILEQKGRGHARGDISLKGDSRGLSLGSGFFDGTPATVTIKVDPAQIATLGTRKLNLLIRVKNARRDQILKVPIHVRLKAHWGAMLWWSLVFGLVVGGALGLVRWLIGLLLPVDLFPRSDWVSINDIEGMLLIRGGDGIIMAGAFLSLLLVGAVFWGLVYLRGKCRV